MNIRYARSSLSAVLSIAILTAGCTQDERSDSGRARQAADGRTKQLEPQRGGPLPTRPVAVAVEPPIVAAARVGDLAQVRRLVEQEKAPVDTRGSLEVTPLMVAAQAGHEPVVQYLVKQGADANLKDAKGKTPQQYARDAGHEKVAKMLERSDVEAPKGPAQPKAAPPTVPAPDAGVEGAAPADDSK